MRKFFSVLLIAILSGSLLFSTKNVSAAASASMYFSPACGPVYNGNNITLDVHENSFTTQINAVQSDINYSNSQFNVVSVTVASGWSQVQNDTSTPGTILFAAFPNPPGSSVTGDNKVATVVLQAKTGSGTGTLSFANSSAVTESSDSANILTQKGIATYPQTLAHTCGSVVKDPNGPNIFVISDGQRHYIPAPNIFVSQGYNWGWISTATSADMALPSGAGINFRDGTVVQGSGSSIYVIDNSSGSSLKRPINSIGVYNALGYTSQDVISVTDAQLPPSGAAVTSTSHPNGSLVQDTNKTIYLVDNGTKRYIGSVYVLYTYGYNYYQIKNATTADLALPSGDNMYLRDGLLFKGFTGPNLYLTDSMSGVGRKRLITNMTTFAALGYNTGQIIQVPNSNLPPVDGPNL
jgi:hypothetical protein